VTLRRLVPAAALTGVLSLSAVLLLPLCAMAHRCGCSWPWAGAEARCNVHAMSGPHCPWCEHPALGGAAAAGIGAAQAAVFLGLRRRGRSLATAALVSAGSLAVAGPLVTALLWLPTDYPHLFVADARARLGLPAGPVACLRR
jgi:hypothetical protein